MNGALLQGPGDHALAVARDHVTVRLLHDLVIEGGDHPQADVNELAPVQPEVLDALEPPIADGV